MSDAPVAVDHLLLDQYVKDGCTPDERHLVEQWAASNPANRKRLVLAQLLWQRGQVALPEADVPAAWHALREREQIGVRSAAGLRLTEESDDASDFRRGLRSSQTGFANRGVSSVPTWAALAACLLVAIGVGTLARTGHRTSREPFVSGFQYATDAAERRTVLLEDGTQVSLAPSSRIQVAKDYGTGSREIRLQGEAYFTVMHNESRPFSVQTRDAVVRDVGTSFDLKAYADDAIAHVAVTEGAVAITRIGCLSGDTQSHCVAAARQGDLALIDATGVAVKHLGDVHRYAAWMQGQLMFDSAPLRDVARDLERTFGLQITIADSTMSQRHVTGKFDNVPIDEVLDEITRTIGARFERHGRSVVINEASTDAVRREGKVPPPLATALASESAR